MLMRAWAWPWRACTCVLCVLCMPPLVRPTLCHLQDPAGLQAHDKFVKKLKQAELEMIAANDATNPASRARSSPAGVAYRLMYPSTVTEPVTPANKGMTGRGIP